ncbi:unnamed protein product [Moneuplotes crassus]|uniref:Uncharacterized protein n=1 Tax=Euplotes crassus TaxID=5936 RepID=A0AAD1Y034_EUPCR|nr:unnamed protein product [Moneuplotes crassus]
MGLMSRKDLCLLYIKDLLVLAGRRLKPSTSQGETTFNVIILDLQTFSCVPYRLFIFNNSCERWNLFKAEYLC